MTPADILLANRLADAAGQAIRPFFRSAFTHESKADASPVTEADRAAESAIRRILDAECPRDGIIGEEFGEKTGTSGRRWVIDPIDGTANLMRGVPVWGALIALAVDGKPVLSVVSAPALGRRWWAAPGVGAHTRDVDGADRSIRVSQVSTLEHASLSYNNLQLWDRAGYLNELVELSRKVWRTRAYGDFFSYMLLAEGSVDIVGEHDLKIYDIAALVPIVEQAGGSFSALDGELTADTSSVLASNGLLHSLTQNAFAKN